MPQIAGEELQPDEPRVAAVVEGSEQKTPCMSTRRPRPTPNPSPVLFGNDRPGFLDGAVGSSVPRPVWFGRGYSIVAPKPCRSCSTKTLNPSTPQPELEVVHGRPRTPGSRTAGLDRFSTLLQSFQPNTDHH